MFPISKVPRGEPLEKDFTIIKNTHRDQVLIGGEDGGEGKDKPLKKA